MHRLKDLGRPERVWQLTTPGLAVEFPPLRSLDAFRHNLPVQVTPLSAATAIARSRRLVEDRLVTLTGSGGVGKTRLALAVSPRSWNVSRAGCGWWSWPAWPTASGVAAAVIGRAGRPARRQDQPGRPGGRPRAGALAAGVGQLRAPHRGARSSWPTYCRPRGGTCAGHQPGTAGGAR